MAIVRRSLCLTYCISVPHTHGGAECIFLPCPLHNEHAALRLGCPQLHGARRVYCHIRKLSPDHTSYSQQNITHGNQRRRAHGQGSKVCEFDSRSYATLSFRHSRTARCHTFTTSTCSTMSFTSRSRFSVWRMTNRSVESPSPSSKTFKIDSSAHTAIALRFLRPEHCTEPRHLTQPHPCSDRTRFRDERRLSAHASEEIRILQW